MKTKNEKLASKIVKELLTSYGSMPRRLVGHRLQIMRRVGGGEQEVGGLCVVAAESRVLAVLEGRKSPHCPPFK